MIFSWRTLVEQGIHHVEGPSFTTGREKRQGTKRLERDEKRAKFLAKGIIGKPKSLRAEVRHFLKDGSSYC